MGTQLSETCRELFRWYPIPPSALHEALQVAAQQEGWVPPWAYGGQKQRAGKSSGTSRAGRASIRKSIVVLARTQLSADLRRTPYSDQAIQALQEKYVEILKKDKDDPNPIVSAIHSAISDADRVALRRASIETLKKDLKEIRRKSGVKR